MGRSPACKPLAVIVETTCQPISEQYIDKRNGQIRDKISTENMTTESQPENDYKDYITENGC
jgi:hypothetical protein